MLFLVGDYLSTNLIRIFDTNSLYPQCPACSLTIGHPFCHYKMSSSRNAIAKILIFLLIHRSLSEKLHFAKQNSLLFTNKWQKTPFIERFTRFTPIINRWRAPHYFFSNSASGTCQIGLSRISASETCRIGKCG